MDQNSDNLTILNIFLKFCKVKNLNFDEEIKKLAEMTCYERKSDILLQMRNISATLFHAEKKRGEHIVGKRTKFLFWARTLNLLYDIPLENFYLPDKFTSNFLYKPQLKSTDYTLLHLSINYDSGKSKLAIGKKYRDKYYNAVKPAIERITKNYIAYDYIEKQNLLNPYHLAPYFEVHSQIYSDIEKQLAHQNFEYCRFLALPIRIDISETLKDFCNNVRSTYSLAAVLDHCSVTLFEHICRCIFLHADRFDYNKTGFFIIETPLRTYHWVLVDDKYIISEYYKYTNGLCTPSFIFIEEVNDKNKILMNTYQSEAEKLLWVNQDEKLSNPPIKADKEFEHAIESIYLIAKDDFDNIEKNHPDKTSSERAIISGHFKITESKWNFYNSIKKSVPNSLT